MSLRIKFEELNQTAQVLFKEAEHIFLRTLRFVNRFYPDSTTLSYGQGFFSEPGREYENGGDTRCAGTVSEQTIVAPLYRSLGDIDCEIVGTRGHWSDHCLVYSTMVRTRDRDLKVGLFTSSISIVTTQKETMSRVNSRICYSTGGLAIPQVSDLTKLLFEIESLKNLLDMKTKVTEVFEDYFPKSV